MTVSYIAHKGGQIHFDDLQLEHGYAPQKAYQQSKLANAIFGIELDRRLRAAGSPILSVLAHPGYSATNLQSTGPTGMSFFAMKLGHALYARQTTRGAPPPPPPPTPPTVRHGAVVRPPRLHSSSRSAASSRSLYRRLGRRPPRPLHLCRVKAGSRLVASSRLL